MLQTITCVTVKLVNNKVILMQHKSRLFGSQLCGVIRQQFQYGNEKKKIVKCEKCAGTILTYIDNSTIIGYTSLWIFRSHFQVHKGGSQAVFFSLSFTFSL